MDLTNLNLMELIPSNLIILVAVLYVLGIGLKKSITVQDKYITLVLLVLGITFAVLLAIINAQYKTMLEVIFYLPFINIGAGRRITLWVSLGVP